MDSLETTRVDEFKVDWTSINKEKKGTRGGLRNLYKKYCLTMLL